MLSSIIIVGAGASGLIAARRLSAAGFPVTVLEAADLPGGRILTLSPPGFSGSVEGGAEFIHGHLPISLQLAEEAGITLLPVHGQMTRIRGEQESGGDRKKGEEDGLRSPGWGELMEKMGKLKEDQPIAAFLATEFPEDEYAGLRDSVRRFAEGYDLADLHTVSTFALYKEWVHEGDEEEYRPEGGYGRLVDHLVGECRKNGCFFHFSSPVTGVSWQPGRVTVTTADGREFTGDRLLTTVSLGVLQTSLLRFSPAIPDYILAAGRIGYGSVIKILLEFKTPFWKEKMTGDRTHFLLSDQPVPTWWTQTGLTRPLLTGWLAGRAMNSFRRLDRSGRIDSCLDSLAGLFSNDRDFLREQLVASLVLDWEEAPYTRGGYSFDTVPTPAARALLSQPLAETLYFAGEALYEGPVPGTVEAAFSSGLRVAEKIIAQS